MSHHRQLSDDESDDGDHPGYSHNAGFLEPPPDELVLGEVSDTEESLAGSYRSHNMRLLTYPSAESLQKSDADSTYTGSDALSTPSERESVSESDIIRLYESSFLLPM